MPAMSLSFCCFVAADQDALAEKPSLHLPCDAGGRVQQTPITHDVWEHKALQVLLEKPVLNYGIREHWKTSLHEGWHLGQQPLTAPLGQLHLGKDST